MQLLHFIKY